jgi:hypothetical protein
MHDKMIGPFLFPEKIMTGRSYLDMLELYALPQLQTKVSSNKMGHRHISATKLGTTWTEKWIVRSGPIALPPRSPDLTPLHAFCGVM